MPKMVKVQKWASPKILEEILGTTWSTQNHQKPCFWYLKTSFLGGENLCFSWFWVLLVVSFQKQRVSPPKNLPKTRFFHRFSGCPREYLLLFTSARIPRCLLSSTNSARSSSLSLDCETTWQRKPSLGELS